MKKFFLIVISVLAVQFSNAQNIIDQAISYVTQTSTTIGDAKVTFNGNVVLVTNFSYSIGITGINQYSYDGFSFYKLDEFVYKMIMRKATGSYVTIKMNVARKDKYGNKIDNIVEIGRIDVAESKKYKDFNFWRQESKHQSERMFRSKF